MYGDLILSKVINFPLSLFCWSIKDAYSLTHAMGKWHYLERHRNRQSCIWTQNKQTLKDTSKEEQDPKHIGKQRWLPCSAQVDSLVVRAHRLGVVEFSASSLNLQPSAPSCGQDCRKPVL